MMGIDVNASKSKIIGNSISDKQKNRNNYQQKSGNYNGGNKNNQYNNRNHQYSDNRQRNNAPQGYVGAPYNFVSFSDSVYAYNAEQLIGHDAMKDGCYSGEIAYEITAQTPIMVSQGATKNGGPELFYRNAYGECAIPGSTMRGLIRNNVQILGLCSMGDDIEDYALMYRNVAKGKEKKRYGELLGAGVVTVGKKQFSVLKNVKAGYLKKEEDGEYVIYPTCLDTISNDYGKMNYYILSERTIIENYLDTKEKGNFAYPFFTQKGVLKYKLNVKDGETGFDKNKKIDIGFFREKDRNGRIHYKRQINREYQPYFKEAFYSLKGDRVVDKVTADPAAGMKKGYAISSGFMNEKKAVYIIPEINMSEEGKAKRIVVPEADITAFQIDYKKRENVLGKSKEFFALPKTGEMKPVFYIQLGDRLYFGFTPRLRVFYDYTIKDGLSEAHREKDVVDYAKAMFGYCGEKNSYKSRVSFSDAVVVGDSAESKPVSLILGEPKATSYCDYVKPENGKAMAYNDKDFRLRGVKQYWLKESAVPDLNLQDNKNDKVKSSMKPLPEGTKFGGKVRFHNLTADELGLLLWSMKLGADSLMNVGKAKSYGYGSIALELSSVKVLDAEAAYKSELLCFNPWRDICADELIQTYKNKINAFLKNRKIDELAHIKEFFAMKDKSRIPDAGATRFMSLNEYGTRNDTVLPSVDSIVKAQKKRG